MTDPVGEYAFPHAADAESRRLQLFEQRLDPLTIRRLERLGVPKGARCLEIGAGRGSIARRLAGNVGPGGQVTATDFQIGLVGSKAELGLTILRHDVRHDDVPPLPST